MVPLLLLSSVGSLTTLTVSWSAASASERTPHTQSSGAPITIGSSVFPVTLDPTANASAAIDEVIDYNVLQHLVELAPNGSLQPTLATSWTLSKDRRVYTFKIRRGVHFSNGDPLTAADVTFSMNRVIKPGSTYPYAKIFDVKSVKTLNSDTVQVTLDSPSWEWLFNLASYSNGVVLDPQTVSTLGTNPIGTGPYAVSGEVQNYSVSLKANPKYWGPKPRSSAVTFRYFTSPNAENAALESGQLNLIDNLGNPSSLASFEHNSSYQIISGLTNGKVQLTLNNSYGPLRKTLVRQAISYAIDRQAIIDVASGGRGLPLGSDSVPADPYYLNLAHVYTYNPTKAKLLLHRAGYPHGFALSLTLPPYPYAQLAAPLIVSELGAVGIHVTVQNIPFPLWLSKVFEAGNFETTIIDHAEARDISNYGTSGYYWHYAGTATVAALLRSANAAPTQQQWIAGYRKVLRLITKQAVNDWLYVLPEITIAHRSVTGLPRFGYTESFNLAYLGIGGSVPTVAKKLGFA
ncbi:MAG: ABC transporter substrate-binding protein [Acidimicrobiales bacterium]